MAAPLVDQAAQFAHPFAHHHHHSHNEHPFSQRLTDGTDLYVQPCHGMEIEGAQKNFVLGRGAVGGHWNIVWGSWRVEMYHFGMEYGMEQFVEELAYFANEAGYYQNGRPGCPSQEVVGGLGHRG